MLENHIIEQKITKKVKYAAKQAFLVFFCKHRYLKKMSHFSKTRGTFTICNISLGSKTKKRKLFPQKQKYTDRSQRKTKKNKKQRKRKKQRKTKQKREKL